MNMQSPAENQAYDPSTVCSLRLSLNFPQCAGLSRSKMKRTVREGASGREAVDGCVVDWYFFRLLSRKGRNGVGDQMQATVHHMLETHEFVALKAMILHLPIQKYTLSLCFVRPMPSNRQCLTSVFSPVSSRCPPSHRNYAIMRE